MHKKQRPSIRRQFVFNFHKFLPMPRPLSKVFLGGQQVFSCHGYVSLDAYCCHLFAFFLHCSQLFRERYCAMAPPLQTLCRNCRNQRKIQREDLFFLKMTMFLGQKLTKLGQIQSCKFSYSLFDQLSFRSSVVSIECCLDQLPF